MTGGVAIALKSPTAITDRELTERSRAGDESAFRALVDRHKGGVYNLALRLTGETNTADEVSQDAFVRLYRSLSTIRFDAALSTWLHRVVLNLCKDHERKVKRKLRELSLEDRDQVGDLASTDPDAEGEVIRKERDRLVQKNLLALKPEQREIIVLRYVGDLSYTEIASSLGCRPGTVASRLNRSLRALEGLLTGSVGMDMESVRKEQATHE